MRKVSKKFFLKNTKLNINLVRNNFFLKLILLLFLQSIPITSEALEEDNSYKNRPTSEALEEDNSYKNRPTLEYLKKEIEDDYIIGEGDILNIKLSPVLSELNNFYTVDGNGTIILPNLKRVYVSGLTINELVEILNEEYKTFIKEPSAEIYIYDYRPIRIIVNGEVETPGVHTLLGQINAGTLKDSSSVLGFKDSQGKPQQFVDEFGIPLTSERQFGSPNYFRKERLNSLQLPQKNSFSANDSLLNKVTPKLNYFPTVFDGIKKAGGITFYSDLTNVKITRVNSLSKGGGRIQTNINFLDVISGRDPDKNIRIFDGDVITIAKSDVPISEQLSSAVLSNLNPKFIKIFITGRVNNPGAHALTKSSTLNDSLTIAGGTKVLKGPVTFIRFNQDGTIDRRVFSIRRNSKRGSYKNPYLKSGDIVFIGQSPFSVASEVIFDITKPFIGINSFYNLFFN